MAIVPYESIEKYIGEVSFEIGHESWNLLDAYRLKKISRDRVIENINRKIEEAMDALDETKRAEFGNYGYESENENDDE